MTLSEAAKQGVVRLTRPGWAADAYVKIHITPDGRLGPWMWLASRIRQECDRLGMVCPSEILAIGDKTDDYEPFVGDIDERDGE